MRVQFVPIPTNRSSIVGNSIVGTSTKNRSEDVSQQSKVLYSVQIERYKRDALLKKCPTTYGMNTADFMRLVIDAIIDDRINIQKPADKKEIYND